MIIISAQWAPIAPIRELLILSLVHLEPITIFSDEILLMIVRIVQKEATVHPELLIQFLAKMELIAL